MAVYSNPDDPVVGNAIKKSWGAIVANAIRALKGIVDGVGGASLLNPSFEEGSGANTAPDNWVLTLLTAGATSFETGSGDDPLHGAQGFRMTRTTGSGNGGGQLDSGLIACGAGGYVELDLYYLATVALESTIDIRWYDDTETFISADTVFDTSQIMPRRPIFCTSEWAPETARFYSIRIIGGDEATDVATGYCVFDGFKDKFIRNHFEFDGISTDYNAGGGSAQDRQSFFVHVPEGATQIVMKLKAEVDSGSGTIKFTINGEVSSSSAVGTSLVYETMTLTFASGSPIPGSKVEVIVSTTDNAATGITIERTSDFQDGWEKNMEIN